MASHPLAPRIESVVAALALPGLEALVITNPFNISYLTGFSGTAGVAVVTSRRLYLLVDFRYSAAVESLVRLGIAPPDLEVVHLEASSGYDLRLGALVAERGWRRVGFEAAHVPVARWRSWATWLGAAGQGGGGAVELVETEQVVERIRTRKDARELETLREAARRLSSVARDVQASVVRAGRTELEIAADIDWRLKAGGFEKTAFDTIAASGPNSALPHARPTSRQLAEGDLVVLDFGGVRDGYCVDLTRTVGVGRVGSEGRRI
jgi:Xaa-Pro aminopeptidase